MQTKKEARDIVLKKLYDLERERGRGIWLLKPEDFETEISQDEIDMACRYLQQKGLIEAQLYPNGGSAGNITAEGNDYIESSNQEQNLIEIKFNSTPHIHNVTNYTNNIGHMSHSEINQFNTQLNNLDNKEEITEMLSALLAEIEKINVDLEKKEELITDIKCTLLQLKSSKPKWHNIKEWLSGISSSLWALKEIREIASNPIVHNIAQQLSVYCHALL